MLGAIKRLFQIIGLLHDKRVKCSCSKWPAFFLSLFKLSDIFSTFLCSLKYKVLQMCDTYNPDVILSLWQKLRLGTLLLGRFQLEREASIMNGKVFSSFIKLGLLSPLLKQKLTYLNAWMDLYSFLVNWRITLKYVFNLNFIKSYEINCFGSTIPLKEDVW